MLKQAEVVVVATSLISSQVQAQGLRNSANPAYVSNGSYARYVSPISPVTCNSANNDFCTQFISPSQKHVSIVIKAPLTSKEYEAPSISENETVNDYLNKVIYAAQGSPRNQTYIKIPKGTYRYNFPIGSNCTSTTTHKPQYVHWQLANGSDMVIDGQGSTVNFSDLCLGLNIFQASRVEFKNFTFQWPDIRIATVGTISAVGGNGTTGYTYDVHFAPTQADKIPNVIAAINSWDKVGNHYDTVNTQNVSYGSGFPAGNGYPLTCAQTPAEQKTLGCTVKSVPSYGVLFKTGQSVVVRHYDWASAISASGSDVSFDNIALKNVIGTGYAYSQGRGLLIENSTLTRLGNAPLAAGGNGSLFVNAGGDVVMQGDTFADTGDDPWDMNTTLVQFTPKPVTQTNPMAVFTFDAATPNQLSWSLSNVVQAGDVVGLFSNSMAFESTAKIKSVSLSSDQSHYIVSLDQNISPGLSKPGFIAGDLTSSAGARYLIADSAFLYTSGRALLLQTPYGLVENNRFQGQTAKNLYLLASIYWGEGPGAAELTITHNLLDDAEPHSPDFRPIHILEEAANFPNAQDELTGTAAEIAPPINQNIVVSDNQFSSDIARPFANVSSADGVTFERNTYTLKNQMQPGQPPAAIHDASHIMFVRESIASSWIPSSSCADSVLHGLTSLPVTKAPINSCVVRATTKDVTDTP